MRTTMFLLPLAAAALMLSAPAGMAADEIYRWVDEDGVVHFGDRSPGAPGAEIVNIPTYRQPQAATLPAGEPPIKSEPGAVDAPQPSIAQQKRAARAEARRQTAEERAQVEAVCEEARKRVATLEPSTNVLVEDENGDVIRLDDDKRLALLNEAKDYLGKNCNR